MAVDSIFGLSGNALKLYEKRASILANNLANGSTPGFKAQDVDFQKILTQAKGNSAGSLIATHNKHIGVGGTQEGMQVFEREVNQPSIDGNTVDPDKERIAFMENAMRYKASLTFVKGTYNNLMKSIRGE